MPIIAIWWKPSLSGSVTPTTWRMPRSMSRFVRARTAASETPRSAAIWVNGPPAVRLEVLDDPLVERARPRPAPRPGDRSRSAADAPAGSWPQSHGGRHASTRLSVQARRCRRRVHAHPRSSSTRTGASASIESMRDRVERRAGPAPIPSRRIAAQLLGHLVRAAARAAATSLLRVVALEAARSRRAAGPGRRRSARPSAGSRPTSRQAPSTSSRSGGNAGGAVAGVGEPDVPRRRRAAASIASIRGPFEPIISGGPPGRGPRGRSSQSRAWY